MTLTLILKPCSLATPQNSPQPDSCAGADACLDAREGRQKCCERAEVLLDGCIVSGSRVAGEGLKVAHEHEHGRHPIQALKRCMQWQMSSLIWDILCLAMYRLFKPAFFQAWTG